MGKRSDNDSAATNPSDFWPTPAAGVLPLVPHLVPGSTFIEPCAGDGALIDELERHGFKCSMAFDVAPRREGIARRDASRIVGFNMVSPIITNPPWRRKLLEPILDNLVGQATLWLLLPLDYTTNLWTNRFMRHVNKIVPIGRVSWLGNGKGGMENSAWYRFERNIQDFIGERKPK